jgi:hypothetical protein
MTNDHAQVQVHVKERLALAHALAHNKYSWNIRRLPLFFLQTIIKGVQYFMALWCRGADTHLNFQG